MQNRNRIEKVQKKAIRIMTGSAYNAHTSPLFLQHEILPFDKLFLQSQLSFMHAVEYQYAPPPPPLKIHGLKIVTGSLQFCLEMPMIIICLCHVRKPLKNQPIILSLLPGMNLRQKLNSNKTPSLLSGPLRPTYLNP